MDRVLFEATLKRLKKYEDILGKKTIDDFWDIVVITAVDTIQKQAYEIQLQSRLTQKDLPLSPEYIVIEDPEGPKIGNGGSTLVVIDFLFQHYGDLLWSKKVIIIHAGGYSQRMPSASMIGKAFVSLPIGQKVFQAIDVKLATYIDLPCKIQSGGMFVCCPDTIEVYHDAGSEWMFPEQGFTGLAGLSSLSIAEYHGVFVVSKESDSVIVECDRFLHKPSKSRMLETERCVKQLENGKKNALTDSSFFISPPAMKILHTFYTENKPLNCEIDAYGDFLQALGPNGSSDYIYNVKNVVNETGNLVNTRKLLYDRISPMPLYAVLLAPTAKQNRRLEFYHLGTTKEYLNHFTSDTRFKYILNVTTLLECAGNIYKILSQQDELDNNANPSVIKTKLESKVSIAVNVAVEYSYLHSNVTIGNHCIISNCDISNSSNIIDNTFMHTTTVSLPNNCRKYVTILYCINEDNKKSVTEDNLHELQYFGQPLSTRYAVKRVLPDNSSTLSLWNLKLFPLSKSVAEATKKACEALNQITNMDKFVELYPDENLYSMEDVLQYKDVIGIMEYRNEVENDIKSQRTT